MLALVPVMMRLFPFMIMSCWSERHAEQRQGLTRVAEGVYCSCGPTVCQTFSLPTGGFLVLMFSKVIYRFVKWIIHHLESNIFWWNTKVFLRGNRDIFLRQWIFYFCRCVEHDEYVSGPTIRSTENECKNLWQQREQAFCRWRRAAISPRYSKCCVDAMSSVQVPCNECFTASLDRWVRIFKFCKCVSF